MVVQELKRKRQRLYVVTELRESKILAISPTTVVVSLQLCAKQQTRRVFSPPVGEISWQ